MRIVLDTNALVSAFLSQHGAPAQILALALGGELSVLFDGRILAEYREVLSRPRFEIPAASAEAVVGQLETDGERIEATPLNQSVPDPDDLAFIEVAISGRAEALVTGNARDFPTSLGIVVLSPRAFLEHLASTTSTRPAAQACANSVRFGAESALRITSINEDLSCVNKEPY